MSDSSPPVTFTPGGILRGLKRTIGISIGVFFYGVGFGMIAVQAKLSAWQAMAMSVGVFSGSAQLAAIGVLGAGAASLAALCWALVATILVINARYVLFGAAMRPWLVALSPAKAYGTLFFLGDGSWMIAMSAYENGERDAGFVFGASISGAIGWVSGTWLGVIAGNIVPDPRRLGLDFFFAAFATAMMVGLTRRRGDLLVIAAAAAIGVAGATMGYYGAAIVIAGLAGGIVAYIRHPDAGRPEPRR